MPRLNWNRQRQVQLPWYDNPDHDLARMGEPDREQVHKPKPAALAVRSATDWSVLPSVLEARDRLSAVTQATVHCDGGCSPNPGRGGWGVLIEAPGQPRVELSGGELRTTNNRMEMTAAIVALTVLPAHCSIIIAADSLYVIKGATVWMDGWKRNAFQRPSGAVLNSDLWRSIDALILGRTITWKWVRGHSGHIGNIRADQLATRGRQEAQ